MTRKTLAALAVSVLLSFAQTPDAFAKAGAAGLLDASVGGLIGYSSASENGGGGIGYGLNAAYFFSGPIGAGASLKTGNHDNGVTSTTVSAEGLYRLDVLVPGMIGGVALGASKFSGSAFAGDYKLSVGPKLAIDQLISASYPVSLGGEASVLFTEPGDTTITLLHVVAALKFWF